VGHVLLSGYLDTVKTASGTASACGELAWVELDVDRDRVVAARGEGEGVLELTSAVRGLDVLEAARVPGSPLALDALHEALAQVASARRRDARVAVAMSGGVDSAVALLRSRAAGHEPVGVTLRLWIDPRGPDTNRACCSPASVVAARETCHRLGVPHFTLDLREEFRRAVVRPFVRGYARGETPNPCIRCNGRFRFAELLAFARRIGAAKLVTGHYARIAEREGRLLLARASDAQKDQSYMLAGLDPRFLNRLSFPLGGQTKEETRRAAREAGLEAAGRSESQEACFLGGADYRDFLARHGTGSSDGPIVDEDGRELGRHEGFWRYTPGQRRGLGIATGAPLYALRTEPRANTVVVGPRESLARTSVTAGTGRLFLPVARADAKLRYRSPAAPAGVEERSRGFRLELDEPAYGVAVGQAAVLYDDDVVVGAGLVTSAS
jgi:tRNA-uridine 2-sulfurtransferase